MGQMDVDGGDGFADAGEAAFADDIVGELPEEPLNQVEPGGAGRGEVDVNPGVLFQPGAHDGMLVGGVIVDDQVQRQSARCLAMDLLEEDEPFGVGVARRGGAQDPAVEGVERTTTDRPPRVLRAAKSVTAPWRV